MSESSASSQSNLCTNCLQVDCVGNCETLERLTRPPMGYTWREWRTIIAYYRTPLVIFITPILLMPLPLAIPGKEALAGYLLLLMGTYWCMEALPLGVTALIPIFLVPMFGIMPVKKVCLSYMDNTTMLLMGGLIVAQAVEKSNLHRRIAIKVLLTIGSSPRWLMIGFMVPTWFLSMWISNTATSAMMMPIVSEVVQKLKDISRMRALAQAKDADPLLKDDDHENGEIPLKQVPKDTEVNLDEKTKQDTHVEIHSDKEKLSPVELDGAADNGEVMVEIVDPNDIIEKAEATAKELGKALTLSVAFAANAGGTGTIIGTSVNLILKGQADKLWQSKGFDEAPLGFTNFMIVGFPLSVINLFVIWIWLEIFFVGFREFCGCNPRDIEGEAVVKKIIQKEYNKLGPISWKNRPDEVLTLIIFCILVILWFFRSPGFMPGWNDFFPTGFMSDSVPVILVSVLLFAIPSRYPSGVPTEKGGDTLVTWDYMKAKFSWDVVLLLGGGFALAEATMVSGLSEWIGDKLTALESLPSFVLVYILGFFCTIITQFTSNTASASLLLPIVAAMSEKLGKNPLYLMFPVAIAVQYAFMLPVATPPNAVAYSTGNISVWDMVKAGTLLNFLCTLVMDIAVHTWCVPVYDLYTRPWGDTIVNTTLLTSTVQTVTYA